jgi:hypothetical protein
MAMTFNNMIDLPGLVLVVVLCAFYVMRKDYTAFYRPFSFFFVYYVQLFVVLKFLKDMLTNIRFIRIWLESNPKSLTATINNVVFGGLKVFDKKSKEANTAFGLLIIFVAQIWRTQKWFEIREKNIVIGKENDHWAR